MKRMVEVTLLVEVKGTQSTDDVADDCRKSVLPYYPGAVVSACSELDPADYETPPTVRNAGDGYASVTLRDARFAGDIKVCPDCGNAFLRERGGYVCRTTKCLRAHNWYATWNH